MTVRELIKTSLRIAGVLSSGETPSASEQADALQSLNGMLDSWSSQSLSVWALVREVFELTPGQAAYTVGKTGNFVTSRPQEVMGVAMGDLRKEPIWETPEPDPEAEEGDPPPEPIIVGYNNFVDMEYPLELVNYQRWMGVCLKTTQSTLGTQMYVHGSGPNETVEIYPTPSLANGLVLYSKKTFDPFADVDAELDFPPGYQDALTYNLAVRLASEYGRAIDALIAKQASDSKAAIKKQNSREILLRSDAAGMSSKQRFNILTGQ